MTTGHFTTADGCRLEFHVQGQGRPVLWQHGLGAPADQPAAVFPHDAGLQRITLMCRGHGNSDLGDPARLSIATFADDAVALLDHLGIQQAAVGGISLGAGIALRLGTLHPDRVTRMVLARPAWVDQPGPDTQAAYVAAGDYLHRLGADEGLRQFARTKAYRDLLAQSPDNAKSLVGYFSRPRPETTVALLAAIPKGGPGISRAQMAAIDRPTLVIANDQDYVHPLAYARELAALIPGARLEVITSKTVDPALYTREFTAALARFLSEDRR